MNQEYNNYPGMNTPSYLGGGMTTQQTPSHSEDKEENKEVSAEQTQHTTNNEVPNMNFDNTNTSSSVTKNNPLPTASVGSELTNHIHSNGDNITVTQGGVSPHESEFIDTGIEEEVKEVSSVSVVNEDTTKNQLQIKPSNLGFAKVDVKTHPLRDLNENEYTQALRRNLTAPIGFSAMPYSTLSNPADFDSIPEDRDDMLGLISAAAKQASSAKFYEQSLKETERRFAQEYEYNGKHYSSAKPKRLSLMGNETGRIAAERILSNRGRGGTFGVILPHSGFTVTIRPPSELRLCQMEVSITEERSSLGRRTWGAVFSADSTYMVSEILSLFRECIHSSSLGDVDLVMENLMLNDIQTIAWALGVTIYPNGYPYIRPIQTESGYSKEQSAQGMLDLTKLQWIDTSALTDVQKEILSRRGKGDVTVQDLALYQKEFGDRNRYVIQVDEGMKIILRQPYIHQYLDSVQLWIDDMTRLLDATMSQVPQDNKTESELARIREDKARSLSQSSSVLKFHYLVDRILVSSYDQNGSLIEDQEHEYTDPVTIYEVLSSLAGELDVRRTIMNGIVTHLNRSMVSMIAVPNTHDELQVKENGTFQGLVPIDSVFLFFILQGEKLRQRELISRTSEDIVL